MFFAGATFGCLRQRKAGSLLFDTLKSCCCISERVQESSCCWLSPYTSRLLSEVDRIGQDTEQFEDNPNGNVVVKVVMSQLHLARATCGKNQTLNRLHAQEGVSGGS